MTQIKTYYLFFSCTFILWVNAAFSQQQFTIEKLSMNSTEFDEFSPTYYKDGIVFCSNHKNDVLVTYTDTSNEAENLIDLYYSRPNKDGKKWHSPILFSKDINSLFQEGPASFYNNQTSVAYTRNLYTEKKFGNYTKAGNNAGIFFAEFFKGKWSNISPFVFNSPDYNIMHPSITSDGKTIYFASDMPGGFGGFDIYVSEYHNGAWDKPLNLGPNVNTDKNEAFPFIHSSGRLFFASKGWGSRGGFDIFFTQQFEENWIKPQNMKEPINSSADDFSFIADEFFQTGFFSSGRNKNDDIFSFKSVISEFENCKKQRKNNFCYVFYENGTGEGDVTGSMKYEWDLGDGTKIRALEAEHCFATTGTYNIQLNVIDSLTGEVLLNQARYDFVVEEIEQPFINAQELANTGETIKFDAKKSNLKNFRIAKYYWDFGDGLKGIGDNISHTFYDEGVYDVKLQLESVAGRNGVRKECVYRSIAIRK